MRDADSTRSDTLLMRLADSQAHLTDAIASLVKTSKGDELTNDLVRRLADSQTHLTDAIASLAKTQENSTAIAVLQRASSDGRDWHVSHDRLHELEEPLIRAAINGQAVLTGQLKVVIGVVVAAPAVMFVIQMFANRP
jgi:hypothetical protein